MRKAQLKMAENMTIMFVFFMLVAIALIFYAKFSKISFAEEQEKYSALKAIKIAQIAQFLPEVRCSEQNIPTADCFDLMRLMGAQEEIMENRLYYIDILSYSRLEIKQLYPGTGSYLLYDNSPSGDSSLIPTQIPVSLYDAVKDSYYFGVLEVGVYED